MGVWAGMSLPSHSDTNGKFAIVEGVGKKRVSLVSLSAFQLKTAASVEVAPCKNQFKKKKKESTQ